MQKEIKAYDDRMAKANAKIRQAGVFEVVFGLNKSVVYVGTGQILEKNKKSAREPGDDHIRAVNIVASLGPEISQEQ